MGIVDAVRQAGRVERDGRRGRGTTCGRAAGRSHRQPRHIFRSGAATGRNGDRECRDFGAVRERSDFSGEAGRRIQRVHDAQGVPVVARVPQHAGGRIEVDVLRVVRVEPDRADRLEGAAGLVDREQLIARDVEAVHVARLVECRTDQEDAVRLADLRERAGGEIDRVQVRRRAGAIRAEAVHRAGRRIPAQRATTKAGAWIRIDDGNRAGGRVDRREAAGAVADQVFLAEIVVRERAAVVVAANRADGGERIGSCRIERVVVAAAVAVGRNLGDTRRMRTDVREQRLAVLAAQNRCPLAGQLLVLFLSQCPCVVGRGREVRAHVAGARDFVDGPVQVAVAGVADRQRGG